MTSKPLMESSIVTISPVNTLRSELPERALFELLFDGEVTVDDEWKEVVDALYDTEADMWNDPDSSNRPNEDSSCCMCLLECRASSVCVLSELCTLQLHVVDTEECSTTVQ